MDDKLTASCGCVCWTENKTFYIRSCSLDCGNYKYAIEMSKKQGNPIYFKEE